MTSPIAAYSAGWSVVEVLKWLDFNDFQHFGNGLMAILRRCDTPRFACSEDSRLIVAVCDTGATRRGLHVGQIRV